LWSSGAPSEKGCRCVAEKCLKASFGLCQKDRVNVPQPRKGDGSRKFNEQRSLQVILEKTMTLVEIFQLMKEMRFCLTASLALPWEWLSWIEGLEI
jgi:hypothetical protein